MRILIVEDDKFYSLLLAELLSDRGIESTEVRSAEEALQEEIHNYQAAIIDVMLPNDPSASAITVEESRAGFCTGIAVARRLLVKNSNLKIAFLSGDLSGGEAAAWAAEKSIPFVQKSEGREAILAVLGRLGLLGEPTTPLAFIVHGHDSEALLDLKNYIQNTLKWREPVILREQRSSGKTLIEKFEDEAHRVDCVFVLLSPDDKVQSSGSDDERRRSRQNVIFELGFFYSLLGRCTGRVFLLYKEPVELPSDIAGIIYIDISNGIRSVGEEIRRELSSLWATNE